MRRLRFGEQKKILLDRRFPLFTVLVYHPIHDDTYDPQLVALYRALLQLANRLGLRQAQPDLFLVR